MKAKKLIKNQTDKDGLFTCPRCKAKVSPQVRGERSLLVCVCGFLALTIYPEKKP